MANLIITTWRQTREALLEWDWQRSPATLLGLPQSLPLKRATSNVFETPIRLSTREALLDFPGPPHSLALSRPPGDSSRVWRAPLTIPIIPQNKEVQLDWNLPATTIVLSRPQSMPVAKSGTSNSLDWPFVNPRQREALLDFELPIPLVFRPLALLTNVITRAPLTIPTLPMQRETLLDWELPTPLTVRPVATVNPFFTKSDTLDVPFSTALKPESGLYWELPAPATVLGRPQTLPVGEPITDSDYPIQPAKHEALLDWFWQSPSTVLGRPQTPPPGKGNTLEPIFLRIPTQRETLLDWELPAPSTVLARPQTLPPGKSDILDTPIQKLQRETLLDWEWPETFFARNVPQTLPQGKSGDTLDFPFSLQLSTREAMLDWEVPAPSTVLGRPQTLPPGRGNMLDTPIQAIKPESLLNIELPSPATVLGLPQAEPLGKSNAMPDTRIIPMSREALLDWELPAPSTVLGRPQTLPIGKSNIFDTPIQQAQHETLLEWQWQAPSTVLGRPQSEPPGRGNTLDTRIQPTQRETLIDFELPAPSTVLGRPQSLPAGHGNTLDWPFVIPTQREVLADFELPEPTTLRTAPVITPVFRKDSDEWPLVISAQREALLDWQVQSPAIRGIPRAPIVATRGNAGIIDFAARVLSREALLDWELPAPSTVLARPQPLPVGQGNMLDTPIQQMQRESLYDWELSAPSTVLGLPQNLPPGKGNTADFPFVQPTQREVLIDLEFGLPLFDRGGIPTGTSNILDTPIQQRQRETLVDWFWQSPSTVLARPQQLPPGQGNTLDFPFVPSHGPETLLSWVSPVPPALAPVPLPVSNNLDLYIKAATRETLSDWFTQSPSTVLGRPQPLPPGKGNTLDFPFIQPAHREVLSDLEFQTPIPERGALPPGKTNIFDTPIQQLQRESLIDWEWESPSTVLGRPQRLPVGQNNSFDVAIQPAKREVLADQFQQAPPTVLGRPQSLPTGRGDTLEPIFLRQMQMRETMLDWAMPITTAFQVPLVLPIGRFSNKSNLDYPFNYATHREAMLDWELGVPYSLNPAPPVSRHGPHKPFLVTMGRLSVLQPME